MNQYNPPSAESLCRQAEWLAAARARALRKIGIAHRRQILDLGCGCGAVTDELLRRSGGEVVAFDCRKDVLVEQSQSFVGAERVCGDALNLPFADRSFDLVFCQFTLLWIDAAAAAKEIHRILQPKGVLLAIEPDYGGMIEHPPEISTRDIWIAVLKRAGADPNIGRKLRAMLRPPQWKVEVDLLDRLVPPSPLRFDLLKELPLTEAEKKGVSATEAAEATLAESAKVVHLPMFIVIGERAG
jgi:SAM-dependent methyltransferase